MINAGHLNPPAGVPDAIHTERSAPRPSTQRDTSTLLRGRQKIDPHRVPTSAPQGIRGVVPLEPVDRRPSSLASAGSWTTLSPGTAGARCGVGATDYLPLQECRLHGQMPIEQSSDMGVFQAKGCETSHQFFPRLSIL